MVELKDLREGVESAFAAAFREYHEKLYFFFLKHTREQYQAEELVQITFLKLWQSRRLLSLEHTLSEQIFRIAKTSMIDMFRKVKAEKTLYKEVSFRQEKLNNDNFHYPATDVSTAINNTVTTMPPVQQKVFRLSRFGGLSNKEIAEQLSISPKTVERHITKALAQLRNTIMASLMISIASGNQFQHDSKQSRSEEHKELSQH
ncbi:MAG: sigma-70 family RNA polymerase sigma factor [Chitinophagaceae bacterium]|nr:MAG: sigma-70 family RNA polymerase sigma factor [Chitinophagaceae bacterium]